MTPRERIDKLLAEAFAGDPAAGDILIDWLTRDMDPGAARAIKQMVKAERAKTKAREKAAKN